MSFFKKAGDSSDSDTESDSGSSSEESLLDSGDEQPKKVAPKKTSAKASKFLKDAGDDSDSDSEDDSDEDSEEELSDDEAKKSGAKKRAKFLHGADSSDDDDSSDNEAKTVVKSAKNKMLDELDALARRMGNASQIKDWATANTEYDSLERHVQRNFTEKSQPNPVSYIAAVSDLKSAIDAGQGAGPATKAKAYNALKNKLKKLLKGPVEAEVTEYREDPEAFRAKRTAALSPPKPAKTNKPRSANAAAAVGASALGDDDFQTVGRGGRSIDDKAVLEHLEDVLHARGRKNTDRDEQRRTLAGLLGRCKTTYERISVLLVLVPALLDYRASATAAAVAAGAVDGKVDVDENAAVRSVGTGLSAGAALVQARERLDELLDLLQEEQAYVVLEVVKDEYDERKERSPASEGDLVQLRGSLVSLVTRLDDELTKALVAIEKPTPEYLERLKEEKQVYATVVKAGGYFEGLERRLREREESGKKDVEQDARNAVKEAVERVLCKRVEHLHYKPAAVILATEKSLPSSTPLRASSTGLSPGALVQTLVHRLYRSERPETRVRALLWHSFFLSLNNQYHSARDVLLMAHTVARDRLVDIEIQVLTNRALAQLGLAAFRLGNFEVAQIHLHELFSVPHRPGALLAQSVSQRKAYGSRQDTISPEQEQRERQNHVPYHRQMTLAGLESAYLVSSVVVEVPLAAQLGGAEIESRRKYFGRHWRKVVDQAKAVGVGLGGPPEGFKDHIAQAGRALAKGEWKKAVELINAMKSWGLIQGGDKVKELLAKRIQQVALRTYVFTYAPYHSTLSLDHLSSQFELPLSEVVTIVSRMVRKDGIAASLDQIDNVLILHPNSEASDELTNAALKLVDRAEQLAENNDKYWAAVTGEGAVSDRRDGGRDRGREEGGGGAPRRDGRRPGARGGARGRGGGAGRNFAGPIGRPFNNS